MAVNAPRGTEDLLPGRMRFWLQMQETAESLFGLYGYEMAETPIFEQIDVFVRGIGQSTDVVSKEMFRVLSPDGYNKVSEGQADTLKHDQHLALRPEGTAGIVRAVMQHNLVPQGGAPVKLMYAGPMFRAERQQRGRLRQFHHIGAECLGAPDPIADAEVIIMLMQFFEEIGLDLSKIKLYLNTLGDDACRPAYREAVRSYILDHKDEMCEDCLRRADINPLRAYDCKNEHCHEIMQDGPLIYDYLCDDCKEHYKMVKRYLDKAGVEYEEDPRLVRGLDYYTRTVFEVQVLDGLGAQNAIGGGGRYDKLMEAVGGKPTPGLGFAVGMERIMLALEDQGVDISEDIAPEVFVAITSPELKELSFDIVQDLRNNNIATNTDYQGRSLKSQLKLAGKSEIPYTVIVGDEEAKRGVVVVRDMDLGSEEDVAIEEVSDYLLEKMANNVFADMSFALSDALQSLPDNDNPENE